MKVLTPDGLGAEPALQALGPEAWPDPPADLARAPEVPAPAALAAPRPASDRGDRAHVGRRDPCAASSRRSSAATTSSRDEAAALREAMVGELGACSTVYEEKVALPLPEKFPKPTQVHAAPGRAVPALRDRARGGLLRGLRDDVHRAHCQTEGRDPRDRRLSRLLK